MRISRGLLVGLSLFMASTAAVIGGANLLIKTGKHAILRAKAETASVQWTTYIQHVVPELAQITSGLEPSSNALRSRSPKPC